VVGCFFVEVFVSILFLSLANEIQHLEVQNFGDLNSAQMSMRSLPTLAVIDVAHPEAHQLALEWRRSPWGARILVLMDRRHTTPLARPWDLIISNFDEIWGVYEEQKQWLKGISSLLDGSVIEDQILTFMALRPQSVLEPEQNFHHPSILCYPELDQLSPQGDVGLALLASMADRELIVKGQQRFRQRICPECTGPHLQLQESCPRCHSIHIDEKPFIHCFSCGHVASQDDFFRSESMSCPKCHTRLRQIGVDYDRPLEQGTCNSCHYLFGEPKVTMDCLNCHAKHEPNQLSVQWASVLSLGSLGRSALRMGGANHLFAVNEESSLVSLPVFRHFVSWFSRLSKRHAESPCSLIYLSIDNLEQLTQERGTGIVTHLFGELLEKIQAVLRSTDPIARQSTEGFWMLLPTTPEVGRKTVEEKLHGTLAQLTDGKSPVFLYSMAGATLPEALHGHEGINGLMASMANEAHQTKL
jgi:GGDEF domain-containing protein